MSPERDSRAGGAFITLKRVNGRLRVDIPPDAGVGEARAAWKLGETIRSEGDRVDMIRAVESGELPLFLHVIDNGARDLPLCFADFSMVERGADGAVFVDGRAWSQACEIVGFHAVLRGVALGVDGGELERQFSRWVALGQKDAA